MQNRGSLLHFVTPMPPFISYSHSDKTQGTSFGTQVPSSERILTDHRGAVVTTKVTEPLAITTTGLRTIRTTVTDLALIETICTAITPHTHTNEIAITVTAVVCHIITVEIVEIALYHTKQIQLRPRVLI